MKYRFFRIPMLSIKQAEAELNQFLAQNRVSGIDKEFVADGGNSFWAISVVYHDNEKQLSAPSYKNRIDYKEVLSAEDFAIYAKLRDFRKNVSQSEGIPAYAIFSNEQLATIVTDKVQTKAGLQKISGIGVAKVDKYGEKLLVLLKTLVIDEKSTDNT